MLTAIKATTGLGARVSTCLGHPKYYCSMFPAGGQLSPASSALGLGTSEQASPWGSPYKAMGLGTQHAWVWGGHSAQAMS